MGKVTKRFNDQPAEIKFRGDKIVSVRIVDSKVFVCEIGLFDAVLRQICSKDIKLFDDVLKILIDSADLENAISKLNNLYLDGERRTIHEKDIRPEEKLSNIEIGMVLERKQLLRWEHFQALADFFYGTQQNANLDGEAASETIFETLAAYVDINHPDHKKVCKFLLTIKTEDPLQHPEDGLSVLRDMISKSAESLEKKEETNRIKRLFRKTVRRYRITLRNFFYEPLPYLNDIDGAETWIEEADTSAHEGDYKTALASCVKAINAAPNYLSGYYQAVHYSVLKGDIEEAIELLEAVKDMPMANKILAHRKDYYLIYKKLCAKMTNPSDAKNHLENLKALADKYHIELNDKDESSCY